LNHSGYGGRPPIAPGNLEDSPQPKQQQAIEFGGHNKISLKTASNFYKSPSTEAMLPYVNKKKK
jgi:hypothetical protein